MWAGVLSVDAVGMVGVAEVQVGRVELIKQIGLTGRQVFAQVEVPHHGDASGAPSGTVVDPRTVLGLAPCRVRVTGAPQVLVVFVLPVDTDVVRGFVELGSVAGVVGRAAAQAAAPVMTRRGEFQLGSLRLVAKEIMHLRHRELIFVISETVGVVPDFIDIGIEIIGRSFGVGQAL